MVSLMESLLSIFEIGFFVGVGAGSGEMDVILCVVVSTNMSKSAIGYLSFKVPMVLALERRLIPLST